MSNRLLRPLGGVAAIAVLAVGGPAAADAVSNASTHHGSLASKRHGSLRASTRKTTARRSGETPLSGTTAQQASAAALAAVPGGTVDRASNETGGTGANEVHVTKSDGSRVVVIEDASFNVLSVTQRTGHSHGGAGPGGFSRP